MAKSYSQLVKQIDTLKREADKLRNREVAGVIQRVKSAIDFYGLSAEELFGTKGRTAATVPARSRSGFAKADGPRYADGTGNTWGGRGPRPQWLRSAIEGGRKLEDFAVSGAGGTAAKQYLSGVKYRDAAGHAWSGRGPKPAWVKEALASGKSLEELAA